MRRERKNLSRARVTLELPRNYSLNEARRSYKRLVRRWHPDRFAADPQGQAEAALRLREINRAFALVRRSFAGDRYPAAGATTSTAATRIGLRGSTGDAGTHPSRVNDLTQAMKVESDFASLGHIFYWGIVLGLAYLLIGQPSYVGAYNERAASAGIIVLSVAVGHFIIRKWLQRRVKD